MFYVACYLLIHNATQLEISEHGVNYRAEGLGLERGICLFCYQDVWANYNRSEIHL